SELLGILRSLARSLRPKGARAISVSSTESAAWTPGDRGSTCSACGTAFTGLNLRSRHSDCQAETSYLTRAPCSGEDGPNRRFVMPYMEPRGSENRLTPRARA